MANQGRQEAKQKGRETWEDVELWQENCGKGNSTKKPETTGQHLDVQGHKN